MLVEPTKGNIMEFHKALRRSIFLGFVGIGLLFGAAAHAQEDICGPTETVHEALAERFGEQRIWHGLTGSGSIIEIWANVDTGTWTALQTYSRGESCVREDGSSATIAEIIPTGAPA
jgi:hypothetical protein